MHLPGTKSISKLVVVFFALSIFSGALIPAAEAAAPTPIQIQTFGVLPVMVLNFTQTPMNMYLYIPQFYGYNNTCVPMAVGLSGVFYSNNGATITNITDPTGANKKPALSALYSLSPSGSVTPNNQNDFMSLLTVFPAWSVQRTSSNAAFQSATYYTANPLSISGGLPVGSKLSGSIPLSSSTGAYALDSSAPSTFSIQLSSVKSSPTSTGFEYSIDIANLGKGTSGYQPTPVVPAKNYWADIIGVATDIESIIELNPLGIADMIAGIPATIDSMNQVAADGNGYQTNAANPSCSKGVNVTVSEPNARNEVLTLTQGDSDKSVYQVLANANDPTSYTSLPLENQNAIFVTTWRQTPSNNDTSLQRHSADQLVVVVINEAVYAASQAQQCINSSAPQTAVTAAYKPTKEQAADTLKLLGIISAIDKKNPQEARKIIALFGTHGEYKKIKNDPVAVAALKVKLAAIFKNHLQDFPALAQYIAKLDKSR